MSSAFSSPIELFLIFSGSFGNTIPLSPAGGSRQVTCLVPGLEARRRRCGNVEIARLCFWRDFQARWKRVEKSRSSPSLPKPFGEDFSTRFHGASFPQRGALPCIALRMCLFLKITPYLSLLCTLVSPPFLPSFARLSPGPAGKLLASRLAPLKLRCQPVGFRLSHTEFPSRFGPMHLCRLPGPHEVIREQVLIRVRSGWT